MNGKGDDSYQEGSIDVLSKEVKEVQKKVHYGRLTPEGPVG